MKCLIIAGAPEYDIDLIKEQSQNNDLIICADKGYSYAKSAGVKPDIVIGDFDSFTDTVSGDFEILRFNTDKDFTDTHICVDKALEKGCKILEAVHSGEIPLSRHKSYVQMYNEVKDIKHWQIK